MVCVCCPLNIPEDAKLKSGPAFFMRAPFAAIIVG
jgi:hypothetical protein